MFRRLSISMVALVSALLVVAGGAFAGTPIPQVAPSQSSIFRAMPCLNAARMGGSISTALSVKQAQGTVGHRGLRADLSAGLVFAYVPNDPAQATYSGAQALDQHVLVPLGTASLDFPLTLPIVGSDGSVSTVATTATAYLMTVGNKVSVELTLGDFTCDGALQPAVSAIDSGAAASLNGIANAITQPAAASALAYWLTNAEGKRLHGYAAALQSATTAASFDAFLASPRWAGRLAKNAAYLNGLNAPPVAPATAAAAVANADDENADD